MGRVYETAILIGAKLSSTFKSQTNTAAAALKQLQGEARKLSAAERSTERFAQLTEDLKRAEARYNTASAAAVQFAAAEKAAGGATKESAKWTAAGARELKRAEAALGKASMAASKEAAALHLAGVDTAKLTQEQTRLAAALAVTERQTAALQQVEAARNRVFGKRGLGERLFGDPKMALVDRAGGRLRSVVSVLEKVAAAGGAAGAALAAVTLKTLKAGDEIGDTADKLGINAVKLQELRYGAQQSGAETAALDKALAKMAVTLGKVQAAHKKGGGAGIVGNVGEIQMLGQAGKAAGKLADPFKQLGINYKQIAALAPEEQFKKIADGVAKLKTHSEKAAAAQAIFGKGAHEILPLLEEGSAGIDRMSKAGHRFGGIMSLEAVAAADKADKAMKNAEAAFAGVTNTLGSALLPVATRTFETFSQWVANNRDKIKDWAQKAATLIEKRVIPALIKFAREARDLGEKVIWLVKKGADLVGGFGNLAIVVAAIRLAPLAKSILDIGSASIKALVGLGKYVAAKWEAVAASKALNAANKEGVSTGVPGAGGAGGGKLAGGAASVALPVAAALAAVEFSNSKIDSMYAELKANPNASREDFAKANLKAAFYDFTVGGFLGPLGIFQDEERKKRAKELAERSQIELPALLRAIPSSRTAPLIDKVELNVTVPGGTPADVERAKAALDDPTMLAKFKEMLREHQEEQRRLSFG